MLHRKFVIVGVLAMVLVQIPGDPSPSGFSVVSSGEDYSFYASLQWQDVVNWLIAVVLFVSSLRNGAHTVTESPTKLVRRLSSFVVDFLVNFTILLLPMTFLVLMVEGVLANEFAWVVERETRRSSDGWMFLPVATSMIVLAILFALPVSRGRQSVGGVVTNTQILARKPLPLFRSTRRALLGFFTLCAGLLSIPMALRREDRRMWHDLHYETRSVVTGSVHE